MKKTIGIVLVVLGIIFPIVVYAAVPAAPPGGSGGENSSSSSVTHKGKTAISSDTTVKEKSYSSTTGCQNAILASKGTSALTNCKITKSGDSTDENADFYGTNAAIFVYNGATLNIKSSTISTNGTHANAVFAYETGIVNISDSKITTTKGTSGGIMVTGGGTLNATNLTIKTSGNSAAAIRSDRGGGTLTVDKGTYETNGVGSPAIYSTANIIVKDATLTSNVSEGAVVEGANSISLENVNLVDNNTKLNGNSETYKNIFLYQSMSGDANEGNASFEAKNSTINTKKGDTFFITNTTASINLENNSFTNLDGDFLRIQKGKWGTSGSNGGNLTLNLKNQRIEGAIIVDNVSTLKMSLNDGSKYFGNIDFNNQAKKISLNVSSDSIISLDKDTYVDKLDNEVSDNSNIYLNGNKFYVNGKTITANNGTYSEDNNKKETKEASNDDNLINNSHLYYALGGILLVIIIVVTFIVLKKRKNKKMH